jgi:membrane fusion protein (multidrug efflux system)
MTSPATPSTATPSHATPSPAARSKRPGPAARIAIGIGIAAVVVWLAHFLYDAYFYEETDDAFVTGHVHQISAQVDGTVAEVLTSDNQTVKAGDVLARLDPLEFQLAVEKNQASASQAEAEVAEAAAAALQAEAQLAGSQARQAQATAQVAQAKAQLDLSALNRTRARELFHEGGAVTQADLDNAESAFDGAQAAMNAAQANVRVSEASVSSAQAAMESSKAQGLAARASSLAVRAAVADARRKLAYATLAAPADGRMGNRNVEVGNRVLAGQVLFALVEPHLWVVANFKETQLAKVHAGLPVDIEIDALPGRVLHGTVDSVAPASGAQFALLPPDNATGNFTKVVQRVPVKINLDQASLDAVGDRLRAGLSAVVSIRIR